MFKSAKILLNSVITHTVTASTRFPWIVIVISLLLALLSGIYATRNFTLNTDIGKLISPELDWRKRELAFDAAFPGRYETVLIVVDAPTPELVTQATDRLVNSLSEKRDLFRSVREASGGPFFERNGLLFLPVDEVERATKGLSDAEPLIDTLASDPSLRGLTQVVAFGLLGAARNRYTLDDMTRPLTMASETLEDVFADRRASFSWKVLLQGRPASANELRSFIVARPFLDFTSLEPGRTATNAIHNVASELNLWRELGARVRLTGPVPIADDEFSTVKEGAWINNLVTVVIVLGILWLALRSGRLIFAVAFNIAIGLIITAAAGLMMVGSLNLISVAFAVLFVGIGVDFGIQFAVRYRAERFANPDLQAALVRTAEQVGVPLTLAAVATACGFMSFVPTDYRGVSELGQIAGVGMLIAFITSITLIPALLMLLNPPGEPAEVGYKFLAPVDRFLEEKRVPIIAGTLLIAVGGLPLLYWLSFDFNPLHLRNPRVESVATLLDLRGDPNVGANAVNILAPSLADAERRAEQLRKLPETAKVSTVNFFVPDNQEKKLSLIAETATLLNPVLRPESPLPPPTDEENVTALREIADGLNQAADKQPQGGPGPQAAKRLAANLTKLAQADKSVRDRAEMAFISPLNTALEELRNLLEAEPVTLATLPEEIKGDWLTPDGRARIQVTPAGDPNDNETIRNFARAVLAVDADATGGPIAILESGHTMVKAFLQAGGWALLSISLLLWLVLSRFGDVLLTLVPLLVAGLVTLEICVLIGMPLNFANIIALPVLLGVGVAFKIYYIMAWRAGETDLLQSALTRAVLWSALTTATAFGSLWLSSHPGTSSMGKLLALSLVCTLMAAVLFQPALMGKPREQVQAI
jgi:hopanoid biosynthesis associated RND transporter like protein HpnN